MDDDDDETRNVIRFIIIKHNKNLLINFRKKRKL